MKRWAIIASYRPMPMRGEWSGQGYAVSEQEAQEKWNFIRGWWQEILNETAFGQKIGGKATLRLVVLEPYDPYVQFEHWQVLEEVAMNKEEAPAEAKAA